MEQGGTPLVATQVWETAPRRKRHGSISFSVAMLHAAVLADTHALACLLQLLMAFLFGLAGFEAPRSRLVHLRYLAMGGYVFPYVVWCDLFLRGRRRNGDEDRNDQIR
jgi:hypothetical protein